MVLRTLVIAEKPQQGRDIADALGATKTINGGAFESDEYVVTWAIGHLVTLKEPEDYKEEWKEWTFKTLPIIPENFELQVIDEPHIKKQFKLLQKFLTSKEFSRVINACDAGREGQLIFDNIYQLVGSKIPAWRLWMSASLTPDAIKRELQKLRPIEEFEGLTRAARARARADWLIGINSSRAITIAAKKNNPSKFDTPGKLKKDFFSVGRVQTPTLHFLIAREIEIKNFISKKFFTVTAQFLNENKEKVTARYEYKLDSSFTHQIYSQSDANLVVAECKEKKGKVVKLESKEFKVAAPLLFDLTELQKECNKRFGFSADKTLEITQALYEKHKCVTYPRTEYRYLTEDNRETIPQIIKALETNFDSKFLDNVKNNYQNKNKRIFDNEKVGDHHAIIPTSYSERYMFLAGNEKAVYHLIVNRFLSTFSPDFEFTKSLMAIVCEGHLFVTRGKIIKNLGWKLIEKESSEDKTDEDEQSLPNLNIGDFIQIQSLNLKEDKTKPPQRFNDSTLLSAMQNPSSRAENDDDKEVLRESEIGLGTPATRAAIIKKLEEGNYLIREKKNLVPTLKSFELMAMLKRYSQTFLSNPVMTAEWEKNFQEIEKDPKKSFQFLEKLNALTKNIVLNVKFETQK